MNKRLLELAEQSVIYKSNGQGNDIPKAVFNKEKFAEEIIQDCLAIIDMCRYRNGANSVENVYANMLQNNIEKYFDVAKQNINIRYEAMHPHLMELNDAN